MTDFNLTKNFLNFKLYSNNSPEIIQRENANNLHYIYKILNKYEKKYKFIDNTNYTNKNDFKNLFPNNERLHIFLFEMSKLKVGDFRRTQQIMIKEDKQKILTFE